MTSGVEQVDTAPDPDTLLEDWTLRPWVLAALMGLAGLLLNFLFDGNTPSPLYGAGAAFVFFGSLVAAFTIGPKRLVEPALFALGAGTILAGIAWQVLRMEDASAGGQFAFAAGVFASVIALPLFQADFHRTRLATDYKLTHFHVWTDAISGAGALAFTGLSWLMLLLLDQLLQLVGIAVITQLMRAEWFGWTWSGAAFGTALGVLRNNLKIIGSLQNVVLIVLSLLAVPLAAALVVFLIALLASGGQALWDATNSATPVLLTCAVGCFVLGNAIVRDDGEAISRNRLLRVVAMILAAGVLPLALFAAISMGIRIDQHGLSPERIWALVAIIIAMAYGVAYWAGLARGFRPNMPRDWAARLRDANLHLAAATCVVALVLALPLFDFGAISARNQVARLEAGRVSVAEFDFSALRWDFGDAGRRALARLAEGGGEGAEPARLALAETERRYFGEYAVVEDRGPFTGQIVMDPAGSEITDDLRSIVFEPFSGACTGNTTCRIFFRDAGSVAVVLDDRCTDEMIAEEGRTGRKADCAIDVTILQLHDAGWKRADTRVNIPEMSPAEELESLRAEREAILRGDVRIEPAPLRQVYIGDQPVDRPFD